MRRLPQHNSNPRALRRARALLLAAPLAAFGDDTVDSLLKKLKTGDGAARVAAVRSLAAMTENAPTIVPVLAKTLREDLEPSVRVACAEALERLGLRAKEASRALAECVGGDGDPTVRRRATKALRAVGARAADYADALAKALQSETDEENTKELADLLVHLLQFGARKTVRPAAFELLHHERAAQRRCGAFLMSNFDSIDSSESAELERVAAEDSDPKARYYSELALAAGRHDRERQQALVQRGPAPAGMRRRAADPDAKKPASRVDAYSYLKQLRHDNPAERVMGARNVRRTAAQLGDWRDALGDVLAERIKSDAAADVRAEAARALAAVAFDACEERTAVREAMRDASPDVREAAAASLGIFGTELSALSVERLAQCRVADASRRVRLAAEKSMKRIAATWYLESLPRAARSKGAAAAAAAAQSAMQTFDASAAAGYAAALGDRDLVVRVRAAQELALLGANAARAMPALVKSLADASAAVRSEAARAVFCIGTTAPGLEEALIKLEKDADPRVRARATSAFESVRAAHPAPASQPAEPAPAASAPPIEPQMAHLDGFSTSAGELTYTVYEDSRSIAFQLKLSNEMTRETGQSEAFRLALLLGKRVKDLLQIRATVTDARDRDLGSCAAAPARFQEALDAFAADRPPLHELWKRLADQLDREETGARPKPMKRPPSDAEIDAVEAPPPPPESAPASAPSASPLPPLSNDEWVRRVGALLEGEGGATLPKALLDVDGPVVELQLEHERFDEDMAAPDAVRLSLKVLRELPQLETLRVRVRDKGGKELSTAVVRAERARRYFSLVDDPFQSRRMRDWWPDLTAAK